MKQINHIFLLILSLCMTVGLSAQDVTLYYETIDIAGTETVRVYLRNNTTTNIDLAAINLSIAFNSTNATFQGINNSLVETTWGPGSNVDFKSDNAVFLPQAYGGASYNVRLWYISSIPTGGTAITLTAAAAPLLIFETDFAGSGNSYYPETTAEFFGNGLTNAALADVSYDVQNLTTPFPVEWLEFEAYPIGPDKAQLDWITAAEVNNAEFQIERSIDNLTFEMIGRVEGAGNSQTPSIYTYQDGDLIHSVLYYRIRQVDLDGKFSYSEVREVNFGDGLGLHVDLFPNPATKQIALQLNSDTERTFQLQMIDARGKIILKKLISFGPSEHKIQVGHLAEGVYSLMLIDDMSGKTFSKMFVKK